MSAPSPQPVHRKLAASLARLQVLTDAAVRRTADGAGLSPLQLRIARELARHPGQRGSALAQRLEVTHGTLSVALSALTEKLLVCRSPDPDDHRAHRLELTARGRRVAAGLEDWADETLEPLTRSLGEVEAGRALAAVLALLQAAEERGLIERQRMCSNCEYFAPWKGPGEGRPHYCGLLEQGLREADLQVDCADFEPISDERRGSRTGLLSPTP